MAKYIKKPIVIEAIQWTGINANEIFSFVGKKLRYYLDEDLSTAYIAGAGPPICVIELPIFQGVIKAYSGDYIVKDREGEYYPCKRTVFEKTHKLLNR